MSNKPKPYSLEPGITLLVKLGSIAVHAEEMISAGRHDYDRVAIQQLLADSEVLEWIKQMDQMALLPKKR